MASADRRGFSNQSDESDVNRGHNSKLSADQLKERARKHALRLTYGLPTIQQIADSWMKEYGIAMTYSSEKEWASRNEKGIHDTIAAMVEEGKIEFAPFTEASLLMTLKVAGNESGKIVKGLESHIKNILNTLDTTFDPLAKVGYTDETYEALSDEERKLVDKKVEREERKNRLRMKTLEALGEMLYDQKITLLKTVTTANDMYQSSKLRIRQLDKRVEKVARDVTNRLSQKELGEEFEVTDEMRDRVLGEQASNDEGGLETE